MQIVHILHAVAHTGHFRRSNKLPFVQQPGESVAGVALAIPSTGRVRQREVDLILFPENAVPVVILRHTW